MKLVRLIIMWGKPVNFSPSRNLFCNVFQCNFVLLGCSSVELRCWKGYVSLFYMNRNNKEKLIYSFRIFVVCTINLKRSYVQIFFEDRFNVCITKDWIIFGFKIFILKHKPEARNFCRYVGDTDGHYLWSE